MGVGGWCCVPPRSGEMLPWHECGSKWRSYGGRRLVLCITRTGENVAVARERFTEAVPLLEAVGVAYRVDAHPPLIPF